MLENGRGHLDPSPSAPHGARDPAAASSPAPPTSGLSPASLDGFLGRVVVQGVGMLGVAVIVFSVVNDRSAETSARLDALEGELQLVQHERDRMQRLSEELSTELDHVAIEAEIVRWQLAYTEERYARLQDAHSARNTEAARLPGVAAVPAQNTAPASSSEVSLGTHFSTLFDYTAGPSARFVPLDPVGGASSDAPAAHLALPPAAAAVAMADSTVFSDADPFPSGLPYVGGPGASLGTATGSQISALGPTGSPRLLDLDTLDGAAQPESLVPAHSQLARDRAFATWESIVDEAAAGECGHRVGAAVRKCRDRVARQLFPYAGRAVACMLSGNAAADYVGDVRLDQLPTHSVPLESGAVILCDGGLRNL